MVLLFVLLPARPWLMVLGPVKVPEALLLLALFSLWFVPLLLNDDLGLDISSKSLCYMVNGGLWLMWLSVLT